jgi:hypothetical protein
MARIREVATRMAPQLLGLTPSEMRMSWAITPSPDFPITAGAFSTKTRVNNDDWTGFVGKISQRGEHLLYSSFIGGNFRSSANAIAVDSTVRAFVVGQPVRRTSQLLVRRCFRRHREVIRSMLAMGLWHG